MPNYLREEQVRTIAKKNNATDVFKWRYSAYSVQSLICEFPSFENLQKFCKSLRRLGYKFIERINNTIEVFYQND